MIRLAAFAALVVPLALVGCGDDKKTQPSEFKNDKKDKKDDHDHSDHDRGQFKLEDVTLPGGKKGHAALTAHISKKGEHELEVVLETFDDPPKRIPVAITKMTGRVTRKTGGKADDKGYDLEFVPAPKDERKDDPEGQCSHFTAEAKWLKPDDELTVTLNVPVDGKTKTTVWTGFVPKKYGHEAD